MRQRAGANTETIPAPETTEPAKAVAAEPDAAVADTSPAGVLRSRIHKQGRIQPGVPQVRRVLAPAGLYRVLHGRICLGHVDGETVYVEPGGEVMLSEEEAGRMLAEKSVEKVAA